jgi:hypothetical protein
MEQADKVNSKGIEGKEPKEEQKPDIINPEGLSFEDVDELRKQVEQEFQTANDFMAPKLVDWRMRLKLYNNQRKDPTAVGDPLLFTITQTLTAALYDDQMNVTFLGREPGDEIVADNLNVMAKFDYSDMHMDQMKYYQLWDTVFFGNSYLRMQEFDRKLKRPVPELWDPLTMLRDPDAQCMNGEIKGLRPARYIGRLLDLADYELASMAGVINTERIEKADLLSDNLVLAKQERDNAQNRATPIKEKNGEGDNESDEFLEWYTRFDGKLVQTLWSGGVKVLHKYLVIKDGEIPIIKQPLFPMAHDWDGTNVCDLVEDKQRARAKIQNLSMKAQEADVYPMYIYAEKRIRNKADLNFGFNKYIPAAGVGDLGQVIQPMNKANPNLRLIELMLGNLDRAAQQSTATPDIQQGMMTGEKRTLGELNLVTNRSDARFSLSARILGWGEKLFWSMWYGLYKKHFDKGIEAKMVRVVGAYGTKLRPLTRDQIIMETDPDVSIESRKLLETNRMRDLLSFEKFLAFLQNIPNSNMRFALRYHGELVGLDKDVVDRMIPQTADELQAVKENEQLNANESPQVNTMDDDAAHLDIHRYANSNKYTNAHILTHKDNMREKVLHPENYPELQKQQNPGAAEANGQALLEGGQGSAAAKKPAGGSGLNPTNAAAQDKGMINNIFAQNNNAQQNIPQGNR